MLLEPLNWKVQFKGCVMSLRLKSYVDTRVESYNIIQFCRSFLIILLVSYQTSCALNRHVFHEQACFCGRRDNRGFFLTRQLAETDAGAGLIHNCSQTGQSKHELQSRAHEAATPRVNLTHLCLCWKLQKKKWSSRWKSFPICISTVSPVHWQSVRLGWMTGT